MSDKTGSIIALVFIAIIFLIPIVVFFFRAVIEIIKLIISRVKCENKKRRDNTQKQFVLSNSKLLKQLTELNSKYNFFEIEPSYSYTKKCKSKPEYDRLDLYSYFGIIVSENKKFF